MNPKLKTGIIFLGGVLSGLVLVGLAIYIVVSTPTIDPGADQAIPPIERWMAKASIRAWLKQNTPMTKNPLPVNEANLDAGCRLYINNCAVCHGLQDGVKSKISEGFYKNAPIFVKEAEEWSKETDGLVYWFIEHGVKLTAMPAYKNTMKEDEKWQVVMFIKEMYKLPESVDKTWKSVKTMDVLPGSAAFQAASPP